MPTETAYRARWVFPTASEPLADATIIVTDGLLTDVTTHDIPEAEDLGSVAILPGLVNAHVHLEFSGLDRPIEPSLPFTDWIRAVIRSRQSEESREASLAKGIEEVIQTHTTAVGEIATSPLSAHLLDKSNISGVVFQEMIGISKEIAREKIGLVSDMLTTYQPNRADLKIGLSPHAPYSVHPDLLREIIRQSRAHQSPLAMHLAENRAERELIGTCAGEFRSFLEVMNLWPGDVWAEMRTINDYLRMLAEADSALIIHGNDLRSDEIDYLATQPKLSVVYCPRTHAYFQHPPHPLPQLLEAGINVALGTDGRSSNPDLNLWREVLHIRKTFPQIPPPEILKLATTNGTRALELPSDGLTIDQPARWSSVPLASQSSETDPWRLLFG
ncbi:MAG: amidohydrolase family protein [Planctomycetaceae bacterium]|nr:amidohydrolase family protein [Planctomycetaceae bacterium]